MCIVVIRTIKEKRVVRNIAPTKGGKIIITLPFELADCRFIENDRDSSVYLLTRMRFSVHFQRQ